MKLVHGTSSSRLDSILKHGLRPRLDNPSNWDAASSSECVYLTEAYAVYFASQSVKQRDEDMVLVEVDTDLLPDQKLYADEDALVFAFRQGLFRLGSDHDIVSDMTIEEQAEYFTFWLEDWADAGFDWKWSIDVLANCVYQGTIPVEALTRIVRMPRTDSWFLSFSDPTITPANLKFCGVQYRASQLVAMGRSEEARGLSSVFEPPADVDALEGLIGPYRQVIFEREPSAKPSA